MTISWERYYHGLALYMLARRKQAEVDKLEKELNLLLGGENGSQVSDEIYNYGNDGSQSEYDDALAKMGVSVSN